MKSERTLVRARLINGEVWVQEPSLQYLDRELVARDAMKRKPFALGSRLKRMRHQMTKSKCLVQALDRNGYPPTRMRHHRDVIRNIQLGMR